MTAVLDFYNIIFKYLMLQACVKFVPFSLSWSVLDIPHLYSYRVTTDQVFDASKRCMQILSTKLDSQQYMFGNVPTQLDAYMFGHLAIIRLDIFVKR